MGTRSTIKFIEKVKEKEFVYAVIYQQYDGYIEGVGYELCQWLMGKRMINGIGYGQYNDKYVNGVGCLVAKFIRDFKNETGGLYLIPFEGEKEDYNYEVIISYDYLSVGRTEDGIPLDDITIIKVTNFDREKPIFEGKISELLCYKDELLQYD